LASYLILSSVGGESLLLVKQAVFFALMAFFAPQVLENVWGGLRSLKQRF